MSAVRKHHIHIQQVVVCSPQLRMGGLASWQGSVASVGKDGRRGVIMWVDRMELPATVRNGCRARVIDLSLGNMEALNDCVLPSDCDVLSIRVSMTLEELTDGYVHGFRGIDWLDAFGMCAKRLVADSGQRFSDLREVVLPRTLEEIGDRCFEES